MLLAPLDGFTDIAFRRLCLERGAEYAYTEMISAEGFTRGTQATLKKAYIEKMENCGLQLFGSRPEQFKKAIEKLETVDNYAKSIDLNIGCPVHKVMKIGAGSALLSKPKTIEKILNMLSESSLPVSIKIRLGIEKMQWPEIIKVANKFDLQHVTVHLRTAIQMYSGKANYGELEKVVSLSNNPIIANGDVKNKDDYETLIQMGAKNVMIGRTALSNPYIFQWKQKTKDNAVKMIKEYEKLAHTSDCLDEAQFKRIKMKLLTGFEGAKDMRIHL